MKLGNIFLPAFIDIAFRHYGMREGIHYDIVTSKQVEIRIHSTQQTIIGHSALKYQLMVGESISHFTGTEVGFYKSNEWFQKCKQRCRCPKASVLQGMGEGTPEGDTPYRELADIVDFYETGQIDEERNFKRIRLESDDNPHLPEGYIEQNIVKPLAHDPSKLESYRYGRFVSFNKGTAYWEFIFSRHTVLDVRASPQLPVIFTWDFQRTPLSWVVLQRQPFDRAGIRKSRFVALGESSGKARGLFDACVEFAVQFPVEQYRFTPIEIYGGHDGFFEKHNTESCDFGMIEQYLKKLGYRNVRVLAATAAPRIQTRLERTNAYLAYDQLVIARWLTNVIKSYEKATLIEGTWNLEKPHKKDYTHYGDAIDYAIYEITKDEELGDDPGTRPAGYRVNF